MADKLKTLGPRFYAVLALCLTVVGIGGYFLFLREQPVGVVTEPPGQSQPASAPVTDLREPSSEAPQTPSKDLSSHSSNNHSSNGQETKPESEAEPKPVEMPSAELPVDDAPVAAEAPNLIVTPLSGEIVAAFSVDQLMYNESLGDWRTHDGIDISARAGTAVTAACAGTVSSVADDPLMGTMVVVDHDGGFQTTYANLQSQTPVKAGDPVTAGQVIGSVGLTAAAESAAGAHLHFSVTKDGEPMDPDAFLNP